MRVALGIEYDGEPFSGWETQVGQYTVQSSLEAALTFVAAGPVKLTCAGRTDAGVHATSQVAHFDCATHRPERAWQLGANAELPKSVSVLWARQVNEDFHARFSARCRYYRYVIVNRVSRPALLASRAGWVRKPLDAGLMQQAAQLLLGEHDFSAFRAAGCQARNPRRRIFEFDVARHGDFVFIDVCANAFLLHMVRNLVGTLVDVGTGKQSPAWVQTLIADRDRRQAGVTMPAGGLYFVGVDYPDRWRLPRVSSFPVLW